MFRDQNGSRVVIVDPAGDLAVGAGKSGGQREKLSTTCLAAALPGIVQAAYAMPDAHWGYGFPIGGVAAFDPEAGVISAGGVGFDISCGVRMLHTGLTPEQVDIYKADYPDFEVNFAPIPTGPDGTTSSVVGGQNIVVFDKESACVLEVSQGRADAFVYDFPFNAVFHALHPSNQLVFLDEPTSGLDPVGWRLVRDIVRRLKERGTTVFLNSHFLSEVEITCARVAFIKAAQVVRIEAIADLFGYLEERLAGKFSQMQEGITETHAFPDRVEMSELFQEADEMLPALVFSRVESAFTGPARGFQQGSDLGSPVLLVMFLLMLQGDGLLETLAKLRTTGGIAPGAGREDLEKSAGGHLGRFCFPQAPVEQGAAGPFLFIVTDEARAQQLPDLAK